jgi:hypothetical protein
VLSEFTLTSPLPSESFSGHPESWKSAPAVSTDISALRRRAFRTVAPPSSVFTDDRRVVRVQVEVVPHPARGQLRSLEARE